MNTDLINISNQQGQLQNQRNQNLLQNTQATNRALLEMGSEAKIEYKLHILEKGNYTIWKRHMSNVLEAKGLLDAAKTANYTDGAREKQARALLTSALSPDNQMKVINCENAHDIWKRLTQLYENKSSFEKESLLGKLHSYSIKSVKDIPQAISEMETIAAKLRLLGENVSDDSLMSAILRALPKSMKTFITIWKGTVSSERTVENLLTRLMAEVEDDQEPEERALIGNRRFRNFNRNKSQGQNTQNTRNNSGNQQQGNSNSTCHYCKKSGHWMKDCRKKKAEQDQPTGNRQNYRQGYQQTRNRMPQRSDNLFNRGYQSNRSGNNNNSQDSRPQALMAKLAEVTTWVADSGASVHITPNREWMFDYKSISNINIGLGNQQDMKAIGIGKISTNCGILHNVHHVPEASNNLFSESSAAKQGVFNITDSNKKIFYNNERDLFEAHHCNGLYIINFEISQQEQRAMTAATLDDWHHRLAHVSKTTITHMQRTNAVEGLDIIDQPIHDEQNDRCESCVYGKCKHVSHGKRTTANAQKPGVSLHLDTIGPIEEKSLGDSSYFILCKDEYSGYRQTRFAKHKLDLPDLVKSCVNEIELLTNNQVRQIVSDNGTEFINKNLQKFLKERGINHQLSTVYVPQQNGYIERDISTVFGAARTMLIDSQLPKALWAEAINTAAYVLNRTPAKKSNKTPFELLTGLKPDIRNFKKFGARALVMLPDHYRKKLDPRVIEMYFIGYTNRFNTYKFYDYETNEVYTRCDAVFISNNKSLPSENSEEELEIIDFVHDECSSPSKSPLRRANSLTKLEAIKSDSQKEQKLINKQKLGISGTQSSSTGIKIDPVQSSIPKNLFIQNHPPTILQEKTRSETQSKQQKNTVTYHAKLSTLEASDDPNSYDEAMSREDSALWKQAMQEEIASLKKNKVWSLVKRPDPSKNQNIISNRWVLRIKRKPDGQIERYKARLVARGFSQVEGIDYHETYAPVVNATSIRLLFAYAAVEQLLIAQFDVKTAFLNGYLDEEGVLMEQPEGFVENDDLVCLLMKSIYGLKQAPRQWNLEFTKFLKQMKLNVSEHDECVFYRKDPLLIIAIYVDDGVIFAKDQQMIDLILTQLRKRFEIHIVEPNTYLGFQINRDNQNNILLHQTSYVKNILKKYNMRESKPVQDPVTITKIDRDDSPLEENVPYREAIGSLMYAACNSRIDIMYAVGKASRKVSEPTTSDWQDVKRIFRYLNDKAELALSYGPTNNVGLIAYCDADFAGDTETSKSTTGIVVLYGGAPIYWKSQRQALVTLSSTEAEIVSLCQTVKDVLWIRKLAIELEIIGTNPTQIYCDNQSAIRITSNKKSCQRTRHISAQAAFPLQHIESGEIEIHHVKAENQLADMLTKPTTSAKFIKNRNWLMTFLATILYMFVACITTGNSYIFEPVTPIVWTETGRYVDSGLRDYALEISYTNPCELLKRVPSIIFTHEQKPLPVPVNQYSQNSQFPVFQVPPQAQPLPQPSQELEDFNLAMREANDFCNTIFKESITDPIFEMNITRRMNKNQIDKPRNKRSVAEIVCGLFFSNVLTTLYDKIWNAGSTGEMQERQHIIDQKLVDLMREQNMTVALEKATGEALKSMGEIVKQTQRRLSVFVNTFPQLAFMTNYLTMHILKKMELLARIKYSARQKHLDIFALSELIEDDWLYDVEESSTAIRRISSPRPNTLRIEFQARTRDPTTTVYRVSSFRYWTNLTETPTLMEYVGHKFLIYNSSSNCIKAIEEPIQPYVSYRCNQRDGKDNRLAQWQKVLQIRNPYEQPANTSVKESWPYVYVYCYRLNITIMNEYTRCPPFPFRLNASLTWNTTDYIYVPQIEEYHKTIEFLPTIHHVNSVHFINDEHMVDMNKGIDKIIALNKEIEILRRNSIAIELPHGGGISYATALYSLLWIALGLFGITLSSILYRAYRDTKNSKKIIAHNKALLKQNEEILRTTVDGFHGEGTYESLTELRRRTAESKSRQSTSAMMGGTTQFNVNLTTQGPALPDRITSAETKF